MKKSELKKIIKEVAEEMQEASASNDELVSLSYELVDHFKSHVYNLLKQSNRSGSTFRFGPYKLMKMSKDYEKLTSTFSAAEKKKLAKLIEKAMLEDRIYRDVVDDANRGKYYPNVQYSFFT